MYLHVHIHVHDLHVRCVHYIATIHKQYCLPTSRWFKALDTSKWLHNLSNLLRASWLVAEALEQRAKPVLVHCSDGWDRTPQITALAQLLLDPHYRTIEVSSAVTCVRPD